MLGLVTSTLAVSWLLVPLAWLLGRHVGRRAGWVLSAAFAALAVWVAYLGAEGLGRTPESWAWLPGLGVNLSLRLDGLSLLFAVVVFAIGALVMAYSVHYLPRGRHGAFYALLTLFAAAMLGLVTSDDIVAMWVFWEFTTICSFLLIQQSGPKARGPAVRTLLLTGSGGLCLLAAVALACASVGTTNLHTILQSPIWHERPGLAATTAALVAIAAFTKSAQFPFHIWLPDAMVASTPVSAYLHAAAMVKAGIYLLARFSTAFHDVPVWNVLLVSIGLLTATLGAVYALQRFDLKEILAYSTISQLGLLVATLGLGTPYAFIGVAAHVVGHAVFKSTMFMSVGLIDHETGTRDLRRLSDLRHSMPWSSAVLALGAASMAGMPPFLGFVTKEALFKAATQAPFGTSWRWVICIVLVTAASFTVAYTVRMLRPLWGAPMTPVPHEAPAAMIAPVAVGAVAGVGLVTVGSLIEPAVNAAAHTIVASNAVSDLSLWHGVNPALVMSLLALTCGSVLAWGHRHVDRALLGRRLGLGRGTQHVERVRTASIAVGKAVDALTHRDAPRRHLMPVVAMLVLLVASYAVWGPLPIAAPTLSDPYEVLLATLTAAGVALTLWARSRVALVTTVGVVGFTMALVFLALGAPDVAITQLLVEILTVAVMVLLLVRLPVEFHRTGKGATALAAAVAVAAGVAAWLLAVSAQAGPGDGSVGARFVQSAYELTGGKNVVNTILVDFRALDTLGEMVVLGVAALALGVALESRGLVPHEPSPIVVSPHSPARSAYANTLVLRVADRLIGPFLVVLSVWFFLRGHYHPGGGFIAALVGGAALTLIFLSAPDDNVSRLDRSYLTLVGSGFVISSAVALIGYVRGSALTPLYADLGGVTLSTGMLFDAGVYLTVAGLVVGAFSRLGVEGEDPAPVRIPAPGQRNPREAS